MKQEPTGEPCGSGGIPVVHGREEVNDPLISVRGLTARAGAATLLRDIDVTIERGRIVALFGPSGAGKTTIAAAVAGADLPGIELSGELRRAAGVRVGYLPQNAAATLNPARRIGATLGELVALGDRRRHAAGHHRGGRRRLSAAVRRERIAQALSAAAFDIADHDLGPMLRKYPFEFSGGERTRLALAQVLVGDPEVLVVDEPTVGLDAVARDALLAGLAGLRSRGRAVLLVTHDVFAVDRISDHTLFVRAGRPTGHREPEITRARPRPERPDHAPVLWVRGLAVGPRTDPVLRDIDLELYPGEMLGLIGVSGAGKSTLARCLAGLTRPAAGRISIDGETLPVLRRRPRNRIAEIQYVWQESAATFDARRPVLDQVAATGIRLRGMAAGPARAAAVTLLAELGVDRRQAARLPAGLSGGQLQRVALARALLARPRVLLCDEVTTALDQPTAGLIFDHIDEYRRATGAAVLSIGHDLRSQLDRADRIAVLDGRVITQIGTPAELLDEPGTGVLSRLVAADGFDRGSGRRGA